MVFVLRLTSYRVGTRCGMLFLAGTGLGKPLWLAHRLALCKKSYVTVRMTALDEESNMSSRPTRDEAWDLLTRYIPSDNLRRHALAVEAVMRYMARKRGADEEHWGLVGLVHDVDYEQYPEQHLQFAPDLLRQHGWPEEDIRAVISHGWGICSDVEPQSEMEKALFAIDELTGLVAAAALVRPSRSVLDLTGKSVRKKWKDTAFAAGVDRSVIERGAKMLGVEVSELIDDTIEGMREVAEQIDLPGNL